MGKDIDCPSVGSPAMAGQAAPSKDAPWASFDMLQEALVHLGPTIRWETELTSSKFISHS